MAMSSVSTSAEPVFLRRFACCWPSNCCAVALVLPPAACFRVVDLVAIAVEQMFSECGVGVCAVSYSKDGSSMVFPCHGHFLLAHVYMQLGRI